MAHGNHPSPLGSAAPARSRWIPRLLLGAGAIALLAAIVSIAVGTGGPKVIKINGADEVQQLVGGIQEDGPSLGPPNAAATISVFTDLQCSTCDSYELATVDPLIEEYARTGKARLEFHNYSLGQAETTKAAYAATAAGEQDREWQFVELFFRNQDAAPSHTVTDEFLNDIGNTITDLDLDTWRQDMESAVVRDRVEADGRLAANLGLRVNGPSVVVDGPGGTKVLQDSPSKQEIDAAVQSAAGP
jgi:protein-disulfide isomerase